MAYGLYISLVEIGGPRAKLRALLPAINAGLKMAVKHWHRKFLPEHFKTSASKKYGYAKRTRVYMLAKAKRKHHQKPLVWTGALQTQLRRHIAVTSLKTKASAKGKMFGRALRFSSRTAESGKGAMPNMKAEVKATIEAELKELARITQTVAAGIMRRAKDKSTTLAA